MTGAAMIGAALAATTGAAWIKGAARAIGAATIGADLTKPGWAMNWAAAGKYDRPRTGLAATKGADRAKNGAWATGAANWWEYASGETIPALTVDATNKIEANCR